MDDLLLYKFLQNEASEDEIRTVLDWLDADPANLLGTAALVLLADRPAAAADVGFQLSFGATLGILALAGPLTRGVPRMPLRLDLAVAASVAAQCALAPVLADFLG